MYILTLRTDMTNAGGNVTVTEFDMFYELQDYIEQLTADMNDDERELFMYGVSISVGEIK